MKRRIQIGRGADSGSIALVKPLAYACITGLGLGHVAALAQQGGGSVQLEEITVTGSRIERSGMNAPTPVTVVTTEELSYMAPGNIIEALSQLPLFYGNTSSQDPGGFFTSPGSGNLNLRGIGTNRTPSIMN